MHGVGLVGRLKGLTPRKVKELTENKALSLVSEADRRFSLRATKAGLQCPVCGFKGRFSAVWATTGRRPLAQCPQCRSLERHRLQSLVMDRLRSEHDFSKLSMLHVAPETGFRARFSAEFSEYVTTDIERDDVDLKLDLTDLDLPDDRFDVVYASHVLEHIKEDRKALAEIARVLRPGGFAVLPVPIVCLATVEYPEAVATEHWHVRGPGPDYFDKYTDFAKVDVFSSADFDDKHQAYVYEDRTGYPNQHAPYRTPSPGRKHLDLVPVAHVG